MTWKYLYAVIGIPIILILGGVGVLIPPIVAHFMPSFAITKKYYFTFFNGLAAGLIIAVGFVHSLPDSAENFDAIVGALYDAEDSVGYDNSTSSSIMSSLSSSVSAFVSSSMSATSAEEEEPDGPPTFAWFGFIAMIGALTTFLSEEIVDSISEVFGIWNPHGHGGPGHSHGTNLDHMSPEGEEGCDEIVAPTKADEPVPQSPTNLNPSEIEKAKQLNDGYIKPITKMLILFTGLIFHNIFVGIALGVTEELALFIAIIFHQFFEGLGMGARVASAKLKRILVILLIDTVFALACPVGIVIGIIIRIKTSPDSIAYYAVDGTFSALSGGILIYISIMHLLRSYTETEAKGKVLQIHKWTSFVGVLLGAGIMSIIGIWA